MTLRRLRYGPLLKRAPNIRAFIIEEKKTARTWVAVSEDKAREHKLFGVGDWLGLFLFGIVMAVAKDLGAINTIAIEARTTKSGLLAMNHPVADFLRIVLWWDVGVQCSSF